MPDIPAKSDLTYFDSAQLSVIPQLQFRFCELAMHDISMPEMQFLLFLMWVVL